MILNQIFQIFDILCVSHKGKRNPVKLIIQHKFSILYILFCKGRKRNRCIRKVYTFFRAERAALYCFCFYNIFLIGFYNFKNQFTIIYQNSLTYFYIFRKSFVGHVYSGCIAFYILIGKSKNVPRVDKRTFFHNADTEFRSLQIPKNSCIKAVFFVDRTDKFHIFFHQVIVGVRKIDSKYIHSFFYHFYHGFSARRCRSQCRYYLCFFQISIYHKLLFGIVHVLKTAGILLRNPPNPEENLY